MNLEQEDFILSRASELEKYFAGLQLPAEFQLLSGVRITDSTRFVASHIRFMRRNAGGNSAMPYYNRLVLFQSKLSHEQDTRLDEQNYLLGG